MDVTNREATEREAVINQLAGLMGIEPSYYDIWGTLHHADTETKLHLLRAMGCDTETDGALEKFLRERVASEWMRFVPPVWVVYEDDYHPLPVQVPVDADSKASPFEEFRLDITDESGSMRRKTFLESHLKKAELFADNGRVYQRYLLEIPLLPEIGYYTLTMVCTGGVEEYRGETDFIVCPSRAYLPPCLEGDGKAAGVAVALYGLVSSRNWGVGDFTDLKALADWTAEELNADVIGINPLLAIHNEEPYRHSPYMPITRLFYNFLYLDVEAATGFEDDPSLRAALESEVTRHEMESLRQGQEVFYGGVSQLKRRFLYEAFEAFMARPEYDPDRIDFERFVKERGDELRGFALFMALYEQFSTADEPLYGWRNWPREYREPDSVAVKRFAEKNGKEVAFHGYLQWQIDRQLRSVEEHLENAGLRIGLYHDLPLAVDGDGSDAWMRKDLYARSVTAGAPPDPFSPMGQNWGFPPLNPDALREDRYRYFRRVVHRAMRGGGALRIDHAMQFVRLFLIPDGEDAARGAYLRYPASDLIGILALESVRNRTLVIGEDLGTVPEEVRTLFKERGIFSYRLLYFEKDRAGNFKNPDEYPDQALVAISTHDLPPFEAWWKCLDIHTRRDLNLFPDESTLQRSRVEREQDKAKLLHLLQEKWLLPHDHSGDPAQEYVPTPEMHSAVVGVLAMTPSRLMVINQEDIFRDQRQQNMPGTTSEVVNWKTRMRFSLEELSGNPMAVGCTRMVRGWIEKCGRTCGGKKS